MINGIIYSLLRTYMRQNTREADYQEITLKLFHRHAARGWNKVLLKDLILKADKKSACSSTSLPHPRQKLALPLLQRIIKSSCSFTWSMVRKTCPAKQCAKSTTALAVKFLKRSESSDS